MSEKEQISRFNEIISNLLNSDSVFNVIHDKLETDRSEIDYEYKSAANLLYGLFFHVANKVALEASKYSYGNLDYLVLQIDADIVHNRDHCFSDMFDGYASDFKFQLEEIEFNSLSKNKFNLVVIFIATMAIIDALSLYEGDDTPKRKIGNIVINELINAKIYN